MKEYFNVYFNEIEASHIYALEASSFANEYDVINILAQGFVRCINNCKGKFWGHDRETSEKLIKIIGLFIYNYWADAEKIRRIYNQHLQNSEYSIIDAIRYVFQVRDNNFLKIFDLYKLTTQPSDISPYIYVKYGLLYGPGGPAGMYDISLRMNNSVQISSYLIMMKHLLPIFNPEIIEMYFHYLTGIMGAIKEHNIDYTSLSNVPVLIRFGGEFLCYKMMKENNGQIPLILEKYIPFLCDLSQ